MDHEAIVQVATLPMEPQSGEAARFRLHVPLRFPVHVEPLLAWRRNRSGELTLTGAVHLPELQAELQLVHEGIGNGAGPPNGAGRGTVPLVPRQCRLTIPTQRLQASQRGADDVWVLTTAPGDDSRWTEHYAGQLDGESFPFDQHLSVEGVLDVAFAPDTKGVSAATTLQVEGELRFERAVRMRLLFRAPAQSTAAPIDTDGQDVLLIPAGTSIPIVYRTRVVTMGRDARLTVRVIGVAARTIYPETVPISLARRAS